MEKDFCHFIMSLTSELKQPLPGKAAQFKMAPYERIIQTAIKNFTLPFGGKASKPKPSAVLILFYLKKNKIYFTLILRNSYKGVHSAQVSFPGGKKELKETLKETALRETEEEIGVKRELITIIGELSQLYIPPSGFLVQPFVGYIKEYPSFAPNPTEVNALIEVPLKLIMDYTIVEKKRIKIGSSKIKINYPFYNLLGHTVWGATAMMLSELKEVLKGRTEKV